MALTPDQAKQIGDLRQRILENLSKGLPRNHGISPEELHSAISKLRVNRTAATAGAKEAKAKKAPALPIDLASLFSTAPEKSDGKASS